MHHSTAGHAQRRTQGGKRRDGHGTIQTAGDDDERVRKRIEHAADAAAQDHRVIRRHPEDSAESVGRDGTAQQLPAEQPA